MDIFHFDGQNDEKITEKSITARSKDLVTRQRVNFVLSNTIMAQLRSKSEAEQMPMSRIIEMALVKYFAKDTPSTSTVSLAAGVILYHLFEAIITATIDSEFVKRFFEITQGHFENFIYSSCLLKSWKNDSALIGTKVVLYLSDDQNEVLSSFLNEIAKQYSSEVIKLFLDGSEIKL